jgi:hypothetical protein
MPDVSAHWAQLLTPATSEAFYIGFSNGGRRASLIPNLFDTRTSQRADEQHQGVGVFGSQGWNFEASGRVQYDDRNKGYLKTFSHAEFAKGFTVERKLIDDNLTQVVLDDATELGDSAFRKREKSGASVLNNAFTSTTNVDGFSTLGPDSVVLCSASHPLSADASASTQSNAGSTALSASAVSSTRVTMSKWTDDRGDVIDVMPDLLIVPPDLEDTASTITGSILDPASANNAINPQNGRFRTIVWHYLTDTNNWFMADSGRMARSLLWYDRIPLEFGLESDFDTFQAKFRAYMRYSYGWREWSFIYGHAVS